MKTEKILFQSIARGATILEVMISVLLLTFGVLALMAAQLRSVASLSEAENRSIVSQAAEALAEGMQANSSLEKVGNSYGRTYTQYKKPPTSVTIGDDSQKDTVQKGLSGPQTKEQVAEQHIAEFEYVLKTQLTNVNTLSYVICRDKAEPEAATYNNQNKLEGNCHPAQNGANTNGANTNGANTNGANTNGANTNGPDTYVIKIVWRMGNGKNDSSNNNNTTAYSYMLEVGR